MSSPPEKFSPLELLPGGARDELTRQLSTGNGELSADALEALAVETPLLPPREPLGVRLANYFGRHQLLLFILSFFCLWGILTLPPYLWQPDVVPGQTAPRDFVATRNAFLPDRTETEKRRDAAAALVTPAYNPNPNALAQALAELPDLLRSAHTSIKRVQWAMPKPDSKTSAASKTSRLVAPLVAPEIQFERQANWRPTRAQAVAMRGLTTEGWTRVGDAAAEAVRAGYLRGRIRSDVVTDAALVRPILWSAIQTYREQRSLSATEAQVALALAARTAHIPNVVVNQRATEEARRDARQAVLPVYARIEANTLLVREGEKISPSRWAQLQELGLVAPQFQPLEALAYGALCLTLVSGAAAYMGFARRDILGRPAALWLVAMIPVAFVALFRVILGIPHADFLMVPLAATAAMLVTVLLDSRLGLPAGFVVAALCSLMGHAEAPLFLSAALSAWIGALSVVRLASRFSLLRSILILSASNAVLGAAVGVLREAPLDELLSSVAWSAAAGVGSVAAMAGLAIVLERPFGITSHLRLLELLSPDETVTRRMQVEAPGTYTHSLMVATLAEAAAKVIQADSLLCRVAGLYHDIGKLRRPHCFIENQSGDNIHDRLSPGLSTLLIKAHVKDGLELGRALRLPQPVLEIMASHHGTSVLAFFYHRARQNAQAQGLDVSALDEKNYRYPGPKPRTKEAAIVMLADSVEASARSIPHITPELLQNHIKTIVEARLSEGELSESELSLREISAIQDAFLTTLRGAMHGRIAYPDPTQLQDDGNWVAETLGERPERRERVKLEKTGAKVAESPQKRQNKEEAVVSPSERPKASLPGGEARSKSRRRRFKPSFHDSDSGTSPVTERTSPKSSSRPENGDSLS